MRQLKRLSAEERNEGPCGGQGRHMGQPNASFKISNDPQERRRRCCVGCSRRGQGDDHASIRHASPSEGRGRRDWFLQNREVRSRSRLLKGAVAVLPQNAQCWAGLLSLSARHITGHTRTNARPIGIEKRGSFERPADGTNAATSEKRRVRYVAVLRTADGKKMLACGAYALGLREMQCDILVLMNDY